MKTANVPFLLKTMIAMEQIEAYVQKYTGWHLMGLNGFVHPIYDPGFCQEGQEGILQDALRLKAIYVQLRCNSSKFTTNMSLKNQEICISLV